MNDFFFSIIIPVYNTEKYLNRALLSITKQKFPMEKVEVVIVNDASPNKAVCNDIVENWKERLNIEYIQLEENRGTHFARKTGALASKGKYLLHVDPDDTLKKVALSALYQDIEKNGDADYIEYNIDQVRYGFLKLRYCNYKELGNKGVLEVLSFKTSVSLVDKCFSSSFIKPLYENMTDSYIVYAEDQYQIAIIEYYAKNRRLLPKILYNYTYGIGICGLKSYSKEQIRIFVLSYLHVKDALLTFFKKVGELSYLPIIEQRYGFDAYVSILRNTQDMDNFVSIVSEVLNPEELNRVFIDYIKEIKPVFEKLKRQNWLFSFFEKIFRNLKEQIKLNNGVSS
ncbi:MAG: glycosyltransferase family 2 protein [Treponema sp.]